MSGLVGNSEDRFSHNEAHMIYNPGLRDMPLKDVDRRAYSADRDYIIMIDCHVKINKGYVEALNL